MIVYRIQLARYTDFLSGNWALDHPARWHKKGDKVIYTSDSLALAVLEMIANVNGIENLPPNLIYVQYEFSSRYQEILDYKFKKEEYLSYGESQELGHEWVKGYDKVCLKVPSILIPHSSNVLINPSHPDFRGIDVSQPEPLLSDSRLFG